ncbi:MAG: phosphate acyltransferase PlsX [Deltaproteobacteria bacterium]|nr:phosphate acyltransferase PlsX [Deltaproteobacteria bacterium]
MVKNGQYNLVNIGVEVMGGDLGPKPGVKGALMALNKTECKITLIGKEDTIRKLLKKHSKTDRIEILHADDVVTMSDNPVKSLKSKPSSSIRVAFEALKKGQIDAVVTPSNTGAVIAAAVYTLGLYSFIKRPAIATLIPRMDEKRPFLLIDAGATPQCDPVNLCDFAVLGSVYYQILLNVPSPRIGLISNGAEEIKGNDLTRAAFRLLKEKFGDQFKGNVEGRDLLKDIVDVGVCDGFTGNIILKCLEGTAEFVVEFIKENLKWHPIAALGLWLAKRHLKRLFYKKLSPSAYGGAPLLGVKGLTIICHGMADEFAFRNSILVAKTFVEKEIHKVIESSFLSPVRKTIETI